jgi:penicillin-binding protein 2
LGISRIEKYLNLFGFGTSTGVDLPGEMPGRVPSPTWKQKYFKTPLEKIWFQGDTYNLAIGQGFLLTTPLQVAVGISAIANDGKLIKPHLAKKIMDAFGNTLQEINPEIIRQNFISPRNLQVVKEGMRQTVNSAAGSALSLNSLPIKVAAKTGTAQIGKKDVYENWIAAFAPYEKPEIVLVVLLEEVPGIQPAAQRTAREILDWYFLTHLVK